MSYVRWQLTRLPHVLHEMAARLSAPCLWTSGEALGAQVERRSRTLSEGFGRTVKDNVEFPHRAFHPSSAPIT